MDNFKYCWVLLLSSPVGVICGSGYLFRHRDMHMSAVVVPVSRSWALQAHAQEHQCWGTGTWRSTEAAGSGCMGNGLEPRSGARTQRCKNRERGGGDGFNLGGGWAKRGLQLLCGGAAVTLFFGSGGLSGTDSRQLCQLGLVLTKTVKVLCGKSWGSVHSSDEGYWVPWLQWQKLLESFYSSFLPWG